MVTRTIALPLKLVLMRINMKRSIFQNEVFVQIYIITHIWTKNIRLIKNAFPYAPHSQSYHHVLHDGNISVLNE